MLCNYADVDNFTYYKLFTFIIELQSAGDGNKKQLLFLGVTVFYKLLTISRGKIVGGNCSGKIYRGKFDGGGGGLEMK